MYSVLADILKRSDANSNIGNAILYECICTITTIHVSPRLLEVATEITSWFVRSENHNYKYMGTDALGHIIKLNPDFAEKHQLAVIDCLEACCYQIDDPDDTLKHKTLDLLYKMTKSSNVEVIVENMITYMQTLNDTHNKTEIAGRVIELAERFTPSNQWFIQTMNQVFELAGDLVPPKVAHNLMHLLAEGAGEDDEDADCLLQPSVVICWVLGEYGTPYGTHSADDIIGRLCDVAESHAGDITVKGYAVMAITKICAFEISADRQVHLIPECQTFIEDLLAAHSTDLQQRAYEFQVILGLNPETVASILPMDASCEDIEVDRNLSFLNELLNQQQQMGPGCIFLKLEPSAHALRFEAYEVAKLPSPPIAAAAYSFPSFEEQKKPESPRSLRTHLAANSGFDTVSFNPDITRLWLDGVQKKWGQPSSHPPQLSSSSPSGAKVAPTRVGAVSQPNEKHLPSHPSSGGSKPKVSDAAGSSKQIAVRTIPAAAPVDLLDMSDSVSGVITSGPGDDPFKQLEGLLECPVTTAAAATPAPPQKPSIDLMSLHNSNGSTTPYETLVADKPVSQLKKGPSCQDSLQKDAASRQIGVTPTGTNPALFQDLFG
ncbi:unnamed protein product [Sphagnum tenellum]